MPLDRSAPTGNWVELAPVAAGPRQETAVVELEDIIYVIGGFTLTDVTDRVEAYHPAAGEWSTEPALPQPLHHANAVSLGGKLYLLGFLTSGLFVANGGSYVFDPATGIWSPLAPMPAGSERGAGAVGALDDHRIIVAGGFREGTAVSDVSIYDVSTDEWFSAPPLPEPRDHGAGGVVGGTFYLVGGRVGAIASASDLVFAFDEANGQWCERQPMPTARGGIAAAVVYDKIVVVGGEGNPDDPNGVFDRVEVYDPLLNQWKIEAPLPAGRHGTGAATWAARVFLPGGADQQAFGAVADVSGFDLLPEP